MSKKSWKIIPGTTLGKWTVGLIVIMPILFVFGTSLADSLYESIPAGGTILRDIGARPLLALTMLAGMAVGISGFITGLIAIVKKKENALLVYAATVIGGLLILFLASELIFPH